MMRPQRELTPGYCYHITTRCNNREFRLTRFECRELLLSAIKRCSQKFSLRMYGLCIMSNHVHYLLKPERAEELPKIMHWLNWYTAMSFNHLLHRTGHFWEKRYHSIGFPMTDHRRALNTLRYIHANPQAANMQRGWFYDFSNYGTYDRLTNDGITQWHPAFLALGATLDLCVKAYRQLCKSYQPQPRPKRQSHWGNQKLAGLRLKMKVKRVSPGQKSLWQTWNAPLDDIEAVAKKFVLANCLNPEIAALQFTDTT
ncbi:MAG: transposase [Cyanobacteria bacterium P01_H01_bin.162]